MTAPSSAELERRQRLVKIAPTLASRGGKARAAKLTSEQRRASSSKAAKALLAKLTPEQIRETARKASQAYWTRMTPEQRREKVRARLLARAPKVRQNSARKAAERRWGQLAYAANQKEADRLYAFLEEYISAKRYAPTVKEISSALHHEQQLIRTTLRILERIGRIERHPWERGIVLNRPTTELTPAAIFDTQEAPFLAIAATRPATLERAIDWKLMAKTFEGVPITRLTAAAIARHFRQRTAKVGREMAERETNVLLALRFPEIFLERRAQLDGLPEFLDIPRAKRGCKSCGRKFQKVRPNQRYCSARCRAREKRHRRGTTPHGRMLKRVQSKRYRERYPDKERERRRQWKASNRNQLQAQRERERTRRSLNAPWNQKLSWKLPPAIAALRLANEGK